MAQTETTPTSVQRMIDALLREYEVDLKRFIGDRRQAGESYEAIARELDRLTEGAVGITASTVRRWSIAYGVDE